MNQVQKTDTGPKRPISGTQLRAVRHLRLFHDDAGALSAVEFETPPVAKLLQIVHEMLRAAGVSVTDSFTRLTQSALWHRIQVSEPGGAPIQGDRRKQIEALFLETLATVRAEAEQIEQMMTRRQAVP